MSDAGCGDPRCGADYCRGSQPNVKNDSVLTLRDRIAAVIRREVPCRPPAADRIADAVIAELDNHYTLVPADPESWNDWLNE